MSQYVYDVQYCLVNNEPVRIYAEQYCLVNNEPVHIYAVQYIDIG